LTEEIVLNVKGIEKNFTGTKALSGVDFSLRRGEFHALVGENGAGKTTLMNIISGVFKPDAGEIFINGKKVEINSPHEAQKLNISFVHQEIALCDHVTVAENIFMPAINESKSFTVNYKKLYSQAVEILKPLADIRPDAPVSELSMSNHQIVEIARALSMKCKVLILDEPTSALSESESKALFRILHDLKNKGIGIIYISHRMSEVFSECDRVTVLRDGYYLGTYDIKDVDRREIINKMVGRELDDTYPPKKKRNEISDEVLFEVRDFSGSRFKNISFKLFKGEVLGIAGLVGSGRSELAQAICGLRTVKKGNAYYAGKELKLNASGESIKNGVVYLTEDRKVDGLFLDLSVVKNISAMDISKVSGKLLISNKLEENQANDYVKTFNIKCRGIQQSVRSLSGGNQQKVLFSKILTVSPKIIFMDEPTRGIDVGAKAEIYKLIRKLAESGVGVILISSELPEVVGMSDRVMVMHEGEKSGELIEDNINEKQIIHMASGLTK
jgi:ribose transport system ATP-binding protein